MKYKIDLCKYKNEKLDKYNEYIIGEKIKQQKLKKITNIITIGKINVIVVMKKFREII